MHDISRLIHLRYFQGYRILRSVGWPLLLLGIPILLIMILSVVERSTEGYNMSILFGVSIVSLQNYRSDKHHLSMLGYKPYQVFLSEYLIVGVVLGLITLLLVGNYYNLIVMTLTSFIVALLPKFSWSNFKRKFFFPVSWMPTKDFECRSGVRISGWIIVAMMAFGSLVCYASPIIPIVSVILIGIISTSWYNSFEPISMIDFDYTPRQFLIYKLISIIKYLLLFVMPITISFLLYYPELWYLIVVVIIFSILINFFAVFYKYAGYHPSRQLVQGQLAVGIFVMCSLVPFFAPVCLVYLVIYFRKAHLNLTTILC